MKTYKIRFMRSMTNQIAFLILFGTLCLFPLPGATAEFPDRPINLIVSMPAGDTADVSSRLLAKAAEATLKQSVVILNRPGGSGTIGHAAIAASKPDGYTIGTILTSPMLTIPYFMKLTYDPMKDLQPIMQYGILNFAVSVRGDSPFNTFKDLIAYAHKNPGVLTYGTVGPTSTQYILIQQVAKEEKAELVHVPFKGGGEIISATMGGHITVAATFFSPGQVRAKKVRLLALFGDQRLEDFPDIPTLLDLGYNVKAPFFAGIGAPKGVPGPILKKLEEAFSNGMKDPAFIQGMKSIEMPIKYRNAADFSRFLAENYEAIGKYIEQLGLKKN